MNLLTWPNVVLLALIVACLVLLRFRGRQILPLILLCAAVLVAPGWKTMLDEHYFQARAYFNAPVTFAAAVNANGGLDLAGTPITASAAQLNTLDTSANVQTITLTNGAHIVLSANTPYVTLNPSGQAATFTNTFTIAQPFPVGTRFLFRVSSTATNLAALADSTTVVALGSNWLGGPTDTLELYAAGTAELVKVSASDN